MLLDGGEITPLSPSLSHRHTHTHTGFRPHAVSDDFKVIHRGKVRQGDRLKQLMEEKTGEEMEAGQRLRLFVEVPALFWS